MLPQNPYGGMQQRPTLPNPYQAFGLPNPSSLQPHVGRPMMPIHPQMPISQPVGNGGGMMPGPTQPVGAAPISQPVGGGNIMQPMPLQNPYGLMARRF